MLFNTLDYAVFLLGVLSLYHMLPHRAQNALLLVSSYVFYAAWDVRFLALILLSTVIDYAVGIRLTQTEAPRARRGLVTLSVVTNLALLGTFKYVGFFSREFSNLMAWFGIDVPHFVIDVVLPVGISFYTFQTLSYTIDVYRNQLQPTRRFFDFALFVAFFPQLVAGPIERAKDLLPQILRERRPNWEQFSSGGWLILWGLYKKVVVADNLAFMVESVYAVGAEPTQAEVVFATWAFFLQLYCDFSGYTDIARGTARLLGFELTLNFNLPFMAVNITEFYQRWHITLGSWLRDYVYIPLGGNRRGLARTCLNLFLMFLLIGLWHGAAWGFVLYGALHGLFMVVHRLAMPMLARIQPSHRTSEFAWLWFRRLALFNLNCCVAVMFRSPTIERALELYARAWNASGLGHVVEWLLPMAVLVAPLLAIEGWQSKAGDPEVILKRPWLQRVPVYVFLILALVFLGEDGEIPFVYFQF
jgi:D-alanyl-lipoteichoic acid acyltransferase DltB (MBOAT superfamily)